MKKKREGFGFTRLESAGSINEVKPQKKIGEIYLIKKIGCGATGKVYLGYNPSQMKKYAVKKISLRDLSKTFGGITQLEREIRLLRTFDHENIVKLEKVYRGKKLPFVYIVMEYADIGSADKWIKNNNDIKQHEVFSIIKQITSALCYMHSKGIVHQDIKPSNILLCSDGRALLSDFGIGHRFQSAAMVVGTPAYQAPEALDEYDSDEEDLCICAPSKEDVWALGITLYQMLYKELPYTGQNLYEIVNMINTTDLSIPKQEKNPEIINLLTKMLDRDPDQRITMEQIKEHPLFAEIPDRVAFEKPKDEDTTILGEGLTYNIEVSEVTNEACLVKTMGSRIFSMGDHSSYLENHIARDSMLKPSSFEFLSVQDDADVKGTSSPTN